MKKCWDPNLNNRPSSSELLTSLQTLSEQKISSPVQPQQSKIQKSLLFSNCSNLTNFIYFQDSFFKLMRNCYSHKLTQVTLKHSKILLPFLQKIIQFPLCQKKLRLWKLSTLAPILLFLAKLMTLNYLKGLYNILDLLICNWFVN